MLFAMTAVPCDNHIRQMLDGAPTDHFDAVFAHIVKDLPVTRKTAAEIAACGRARWKIENETFNVLKNNGYNLEHNFGHGKDTLASLLVVLNLLAFAMHNACDLMVRRWQEARRKLGARNRLFNHIWSISAYHVFPSWNALMRTIVTGVPPPKTA
jgi:hypothetical protein